MKEEWGKRERRRKTEIKKVNNLEETTRITMLLLFWVLCLFVVVCFCFYRIAPCPLPTPTPPPASVFMLPVHTPSHFPSTFAGKTYFFQGRAYWKFYDLRMRVDNSYPRIIAQDWLQCSDAHKQNQPAQQRKDKDKDHSHSSASSPPRVALWLCLSLLLTSCIGRSWQV